MRARALLLVLGAVLAWGLAALALLRFDRGAAYPPYSSFRPDPLGTKALHDALGVLGTAEVARNFEPLERLGAGAGATVLMAGAQPYEFEDAAAPAWRSAMALAAEGARVVLAFAPIDRAFEPPAEDSDESASPPSAAADAPAASGPIPELAATALEEADDGRPLPASAVRVAATELLPATVPCRTTLWFARLDGGWRVLYRRGELPVLIERRFGAGTLVLVADAFPLSNEGVRFARESRLLAWLLADPRRVVFDETHLGVTAPAGSMTLVRRYRLLPVLATLAGLALLFAWRAASPLLPAPPPAGSAGSGFEVSGRDAAAGIAGLLRRGLPPRQLLPAAVDSWRQAGGAAPGSPTGGIPASLAATVTEAAAVPGDPVATYRRIRAILQEHHAHPAPTRRTK